MKSVMKLALGMLAALGLCLPLAASAEELAASAEQLGAQSQTLQDLVSRFEL